MFYNKVLKKERRKDYSVIDTCPPLASQPPTMTNAIPTMITIMNSVDTAALSSITSKSCHTSNARPINSTMIPATHVNETIYITSLPLF